MLARRRRRFVRAVFAAAALLLLSTGLLRAQSGGRGLDGVTFTQPPGYRKLKAGEIPSGAGGAAAAAYVGLGADAFAANVTLVVQSAGGNGAVPEDLPRQMEARLRARIPSYKAAGGARLTVGGKDARRVDGTFRLPPPSNLAVRNRQVFVVNGGRVYIFTLSSGAGAFAQNAAAFDRMLRTVRWTTR